MSSLFDDVHPSNTKVSESSDGNCCPIVSLVGADFLRHMRLRVEPDGSTSSSRNAVYDCRSCRFGITFHGMWAETNPNMRYWFDMSWWNWEVSKFLAASLEDLVCHLGQYGSTWKSNMVFLCELTIVIPQLSSLFKMAKAVSSTVEVVNSVTSDSVNLFNFAMWAFASNYFPIELVSCSDGCRRAW